MKHRLRRSRPEVVAARVLSLESGRQDSELGNALAFLGWDGRSGPRKPARVGGRGRPQLRSPSLGHQGMCIYIDASVVICLNASPPHVFLDDGCAIHYVPSAVSPTRSIESQWRRLTRHRGEEPFSPRVSPTNIYTYSWPTLRSRAESLSQQCQICYCCMAAIVRLAACTRNHSRLERMPSLHQQMRPPSH